MQKIDTAFDLSWLRSELAPHYSPMGCPSIDPEFGRLLPFHINASAGAGGIASINIIPVPEGHYVTIPEPLVIEQPLIPEPPQQEPDPDVEIVFSNVRRLNPYNKDRK